MAFMTDARKAPSSRAFTPSIVVPPGEQTISFRSPGMPSCFQNELGRTGHGGGGELISLGARHPSGHGPVGQSFDEHEDKRGGGASCGAGRVHQALGNDDGPGRNFP